MGKFRSYEEDVMLPRLDLTRLGLDFGGLQGNSVGLGLSPKSSQFLDLDSTFKDLKTPMYILYVHKDNKTMF
jgi:hypothetical protein